MKQRSTTVLAAGLVLLGLGGSVQSGQDKQSLEDRVLELEYQVAADTETIRTLLLEVEQLQAFRAQTETWLRAQAEAAESMATTLDHSEREGFTKGINFRSREILLAGWRDQLETLREDLPGDESEQESDEAPSKSARR